MHIHQLRKQINVNKYKAEYESVVAVRFLCNKLFSCIILRHIAATGFPLQGEMTDMLKTLTLHNAEIYLEGFISSM